MKSVYYYHSSFGILKVESENNKIVAIRFVKEAGDAIDSENKVIQKYIQHLDAYFSGTLREFDLEDIHLQGTAFQKLVWNELLKIPYGKTMSYIELARKLGDEKMVRAVGTANGKNPIAIIIPCHRVMGSDGKLVGYAGGLENKKKLLQLENAIPQSPQMRML